MSIAVIENNIVVNLVCYDDTNLQSSIEHLESKGFTCVVSSTARIGDTWDGENFISPPPLSPPPLVYEWYIDIGPFFDRFGTKKISILTSNDTVVQAIITDVQIRKWIDLQREDVNQAMDVLVSKNLITGDEKNTILTTPVQLHEQLALKKEYFS